MGNAEPTQSMSPKINAEPPLEPTQAIPSPVLKDPIANDAAKRAKLEAELSRMGLSPAEVRRLLDADPNAINNSASLPVPPPSGVALATVSASRLPTPPIPQRPAPKPADMNFPEFRDSSPAELREAEPILREASMLRRREKYTEAETKCRAALNLIPKDAAALELLGDIFQDVARIAEAMACYQRATQADAKRASAERKYADLLTRQQDWSNFDPEAVTKNPTVATLLSCLLPGTGQFYNGDVTKAFFFFLCDIIFGYLIAWSPWGFKSGHRGGGVSTSLMVLAALSGSLYLASLVDAMLTAKRGGAKGGSGWEI